MDACFADSRILSHRSACVIEHSASLEESVIGSIAHTPLGQSAHAHVRLGIHGSSHGEVGEALLRIFKPLSGVGTDGHFHLRMRPFPLMQHSQYMPVIVRTRLDVATETLTSHAPELREVPEYSMAANAYAARLSVFISAA